ncbi:solute carrier family 23 protein [Neoroseomonas lacus]|uniref:Xanthine/uracil/vitamin C permease n=1 Tax=Neoroseomonas lacus TaxID=287609 RepID=A0A917NU34_9PROT|nr:solute carrier family 23 protein [Neoroseomonas lacus]GGJ29990.1 hypothetical protein GCM10011320_41800 [Neoroseomonas lacus]
MSDEAAGSSLGARLSALMERRGDRVPAHVPDVLLGLDDRAGPARMMALAFQQIALQSIYFVLPGMVAVAFGAGPLAATNYLCLSLMGLAFYAVLQALRRGPVGSGYAVPSTPSAVLFAPLMIAAAYGATMAQAAALTMVTGIATMLVAPLLRGLSLLLPTEVTGAVVFLVGASLLPSVMAILHFNAADPGITVAEVVVTAACFIVMVVAAVLRWPLASYAVLIGAVVGTAAALALGMTPEGAHDLLAAAPWFARPRPPALPDFGFDRALLAPFLLCVVAGLASVVGTTVAFQRATDGGWTRPDPGPIRRGVLAHGLAITLTGLAGGMGNSASSSCVGLSIATRTFARSIVLTGAAILFLLAFCPKAVALFVLVPAPVQAAMLLYVAGFMMAQGCEMIVMRTLDTRRTVVAGMGLTSGLAVLASPGFFAATMPALAAPLAMGAFVSFFANLLTLPLVRREQRFEVPLGPSAADLLQDHAFAIGGAWGLRPDTVRKLHHALTELSDLLAGRGTASMAVAATQLEEAVELTITFAGAPLPEPTRRPRATDIEAGGDAMEAVSVWLALREAARHTMRRTATGQEVRILFHD